MDYSCYAKRDAEHLVQLDAMMARQGVNCTAAKALDGELGWLTARAKCIFCQNPYVCSKWLNAETTVANPEDFCPNASFFAQCRAVEPLA